MGKQNRYEKMQMRQQYTNFWHVPLMSTVAEDLPFCCFAMWCGPCVSYILRKRALYDDLTRYTCCGGIMPCSGRCCEGRCPEFCLCTEVMCCFSTSVASTRFMLQDEFNIQTTKCDNCIIGFMCCIESVSCIFTLVAIIVGSEEISEAASLLNCLADLVFCTVCPCMQTQHKIEMDKRDAMMSLPMVAPPMQQMSRIDQPYPPAVGYPSPQPAYGYGPPPTGYYTPPPPIYDMPPPPMYGTPPPAYPPPGHPPPIYAPAAPSNPALHSPKKHDG